MKIGDKVIISNAGLNKYNEGSDNPKNTLGVISEVNAGDDFPIGVVWFNGSFNVYQGEDLTIIIT